jgi:hypothetical protein
MSVIRAIAEQLRFQIGASDAIVTPLTRADEGELIIASPSTDGLRIVIRERGLADLEVALFVPDKRGSPFEQLLIGTRAEELDVAAAAVELVCDLIAERMVLGMHTGCWNGGRRFIKVGELSEGTRRPLSWIVSWRGTCDWNAVEG